MVQNYRRSLELMSQLPIYFRDVNHGGGRNHLFLLSGLIYVGNIPPCVARFSNIFHSRMFVFST